MTRSDLFLSLRRLAFGVCGAAAPFVVAGIASAAEPPAGPAILQELRGFGTVATVLHVAAHPDDENTHLITYLARGRGYRTGYLSVTRGDGGQNEIGPEFGDKLGVARTQELLVARQLDGGRQFFTRALDFGYSKSVDETLAIWDRRQVIGDIVRVIRAFRPDVIATRFAPVPQKGNHGHHNASAVLALEAFKLAGNPAEFPEQLADGLAPWQPKRILLNGGFRDAGAAADVRIDVAGLDPVLGESFASIAGRSRAMHKTQFGLGAGGAAAARSLASTPRQESFQLLAGDPAKDDLMDGIDTTWARVPGGAEVAALVGEAIARFTPDDPSASVPALLKIHALVAALPPDPVVDDRRRQLDRIVAACLGLTVATTAARIEIVPGEPLTIRHSATVQSGIPVKLREVRVSNLSGAKPDRELKRGEAATGDLTFTTPKSTPITQPYWLREEPTDGMSRVAETKLIGQAENAPPFPVEYVFDVGGRRLVLFDEPLAPEAGKPARRLAMISPVSLRFGSGVALFAPGATKTVEVEITAARAGAAGTLQLEAPVGWTVSPRRLSFTLTSAGENARLTFTVTAPPAAASGAIRAVAEVGGAKFDNQRFELRYDHIPVQLLQAPARLRVTAFEYAIRGKNIGYVPGAGDDTVENLTQLGYAVTTLADADLTVEKLRGLDAVVVGVRAFNQRNLGPNLPGLFAYVEQGGTVVAQYNRPNGIKSPELGPYALSLAGSAPQLRVTDETSPVGFLAAEHAALTTPNRLGPADFNGWVQERGAYFPSKWDEARYTAVLGMNDPGEAPLLSSVLIAKHGQGYYVYTGLAFFRQLPAGVPGAYRLFANLVSLGK